MDFRKENLIYQKNNSLTQDLIYEIIVNFNDLNMFFTKGDNENRFIKIKTFLKNEMEKNIKGYINNINRFCVIDKSQNYDILYSILPNSNNIKISDFFFKQINYNDDNNLKNDVENIINKKRVVYMYENYGRCSKIKKFHFIWFLNDYDGEIIFWNNYSIKPVAGKLLIFPASWCFTFVELTKFNQTIYTISGFIYEETHGVSERDK